MKVRLQTSHGDIVVALHAEQAPKTVANFLEYVNSDFYNGTIFHRVIDGFMVQGGGFEPGMHQKPTGDTIDNEADNGLSNLTGTVAMARTPNPHSASAQFFINVGDNTFLDFKSRTEAGWGYCVFGEVVDGMATVDSIKASATGTQSGHQDVPEQDVVIERAEVMTD